MAEQCYDIGMSEERNRGGTNDSDLIFTSLNSITNQDSVEPSRAPRSVRSKAGGNPAREGLASHSVSSLGTEAVTPGLSVGRKGSRPKAKAEDVESRNS